MDHSNCLERFISVIVRSVLSFIHRYCMWYDHSGDDSAVVTVWDRHRFGLGSTELPYAPITKLCDALLSCKWPLDVQREDAYNVHRFPANGRVGFRGECHRVNAVVFLRY